MTTKKTTKTPKTTKTTKSSVSVVDVTNDEKKISSTSTRIVLDIPTASMERFKMLCSLVGETQSSMVTKAIDDYVKDREELIEQFIKLRTQVTK